MSPLDFMYHSNYDIDDIVQECSISIAKALVILHSCTEPSIWYFIQHIDAKLVHRLYFVITKDKQYPALKNKLRTVFYDYFGENK